MLNTNSENDSVDISDDTSLAKEDLLKALDFEINQISAEQQRNGWTKWALYGVLAGSLWLLLEQWEKGNFDYFVVLLLVLVFSIGLDIIRQARRLLPRRPNRYKRLLRFRFLNEIENSSAAFFLYAIRHFVVFLIALYFVNRVSWLQAGIVLIYYGQFSLFSLLAFAFYYFDPQAQTIQNTESKMSLKRYYSYWGITIIALAWGMVGYFNAATTYYSGGISIANFRIAGLLVVIAYTFYLLTDQTKKVPLLSVLTEIRRDLSFGRIDLETAIKQAEIVIAGIFVDEKLQEDIAAVMPLLEQRSSEFNKVYDKIISLSKEIPKQSSDITKEQERKAREILSPCLIEIGGILKKSQEEEKLERRLRIHTSMVNRESPEKVKSAKDFLKTIEDLDSEMANKGEALLNRHYRK